MEFDRQMANSSLGTGTMKFSRLGTFKIQHRAVLFFVQDLGLVTQGESYARKTVDLTGAPVGACRGRLRTRLKQE